MTSYQIKNKQAKRKKQRIIAMALIVVGLGLLITAGVMEASHYPWGLLFGTSTQNASEIADPSPIQLDEEDAGVNVTFEIPSGNPADAAAGDAGAVSSNADLPGNEADTAAAPAVTKYVILGMLKIPVLNVSQNLLEGVGKQMKYGVGHVPTTEAPGQKGNCVIAGHRPYPFRYLDKLKAGDTIVIKTAGITYTYTVFESFDVLPTEVWVLKNIAGEDYALTLITCTPYMVSSHRMIIRARLTDIDGKSPEAYYGIPTTDTLVTDPITPDTSVTDMTTDITNTTETTDPVTSTAPYEGVEVPPLSTDVSPSEVLPTENTPLTTG